MFSQKDAGGYIDVCPGIKRKTLVYAENTLMTEFTLAEGADLPRHDHPQEQTGYLVSGHLILTIGDEDYDVSPGSSWAIPGGVEHKAKALENSVAVEVFAPLRTDYLP